MTKTPISLIIDDGAPINLYYFHDLARRHELLVPVKQVMRFGEICGRYGVRGKFSVVPMPACMGRIDQELSHCPQEHLVRFLDAVRQRVAPHFSITPEILTHFCAYDLRRQQFTRIMEDEYIGRCDAEEIADYVSLAIEILCNVNLEPDGVTSPWMTGSDNEQNYAQGIGMAFRRTLGRDRSFYFLHHRPELMAPKVMCHSAETGTVISIPRTIPDLFWPGNTPGNDQTVLQEIRQGIDNALSADGKSGEIPQQLEEGNPIVLVTHWTSLFSDGRFYGLDGFECLIERIHRHLGGQIEWLTFREFAELA
ncbi:MAG: hypothetical protein II943_04555 [Victivallales bacterium]|nr:hypothetical protein [Victivallales bacterium]